MHNVEDKKRITAQVPASFHKEVKTELAKRGLSFGDTLMMFYNKYFDLNKSATELDMEPGVYQFLDEQIQ